ncbi:MAG: hypothetical protein JNJ56_04250 [Ignavibacteria bacterium]|nr:hypothetical protein [Ignavibacteria bacterium]
MSEGKNNIEAYLDGKIRNSLRANTSPDFIPELLKRIELEKEFAKEDQKTARIVRIASGGFIVLLSILTVVFAMLIKAKSDGKETDYLSAAVNKFSDYIEYISILASENTGFTFSLQTGIIIFLIMVFVFAFSYADKILYKKSIKQ